jgi:glycosyltransferase involved in cell wall biosynthesis
MESLNIAFYSDSYLPAVDGVVSSMLNFSGELERRGHNVYTFASSRWGKKGSGRLFLYPGTALKAYPQYSVALFPYNSFMKLNNLSIDMIHSHTPFMMGFSALIAAKMGKYPHVSTFHTLINNRSVIEQYYPKNKNLKKFTSKYLWLYTKFFYNRCNRTITPTKTMESFMNRHGITNTSIVPNSVDIKRFNPKVGGSGIRKRLGIREREKMVLYLGRTSREKRLDVMLKACKVLSKRERGIKFVIGGTGPAEQHYKSLARKLGIERNVSFLGFVDNKTLPHLYAAADAFCMPSTFETQGVVCLEAMASGKPVVGADFMALRELIRSGKNGEKFAPGDYTGCARMIEKVLNNSRAYTKGAVSTAAEFSIERTTDELLDTYNDVLSNWAIN